MIFNFAQVSESRILTRLEPVSVAEGGFKEESLNSDLWDLEIFRIIPKCIVRNVVEDGYTASDVIHSIDLTEPQGKLEKPQGKIKNNENLQRASKRCRL